MTASGGPTVEGWFASRGWGVMPFQRVVWDAFDAGRSGLVHSATGTGKTHAVWLGPVRRELQRAHAGNPGRGGGLRVLWITPLRALATDTVEALAEPLGWLGLGWTVEKRTGDTGSSIKARQLRAPPTALVTTPESATLMLSRADAERVFRTLDLIVVDEWHELIGSKRGVQTELALSRLRALCPGVPTWGLSATLGNTGEAMRVLLGSDAERGELVRGPEGKAVEIDTVLPPGGVERFPQAGHLGVQLAGEVVKEIHAAGTTLVFTNTRSQTELWFRAIQKADPGLVGRVALHHGSLEGDIRRRVEAMLRVEAGESRLKCVVCTSSLDLGVDFAPVDLVVQIGSPKGVARLAQRAGRSGHRPGEVSRIVGVPTHALELVEFAAAREALRSGHLEARTPLDKPLDVLAQHLVTCALGGGFVEAELLAEVRTTHAYRHLTDEEWGWAMDFCRRGGESLRAYPQFARIELRRAENGGPDRYIVPSRKLATAHRLGIGTIVSDEGVLVKYQSGRTLGTIEESFISKLSPGQKFIFAGKPLVLERLREMTAWVSRAKSARGVVPRWNGGRMPLSTQLADAALSLIARAGQGEYAWPEMEAVRPILERQAAVSLLPGPGVLVVERVEIRGEVHYFVFPFAGRLVHEGLGAVLSMRASRLSPVTVISSSTDHGIELRCETALELDAEAWRALLSPEGLTDDLLEAVRAAQLSRRHFREIARVAGLTQQGYPGRKSRPSYLQASSEMFFDVFEEFDPGNMLLEQARREVLESQLEYQRMAETLGRVARMRIEVVATERLSPLAFPVWAESLRSTTVSSESWQQRVRRMAERLESYAGA